MAHNVALRFPELFVLMQTVIVGSLLFIYLFIYIYIFLLIFLFFLFLFFYYNETRIIYWV